MQNKQLEKQIHMGLYIYYRRKRSLKGKPKFLKEEYVTAGGPHLSLLLTLSQLKGLVLNLCFSRVPDILKNPSQSQKSNEKRA